MNVMITGATGFAGSEVLNQALEDPGIERVLVLVRRSTGVVHPKLEEHVLGDFLEYRGIDLSQIDACIWTLGVSQVGISEADYITITLEYTLAAARALFTANPRARFVLVTGQSSDPTERRTSLLSRVKGRTERLLMELAPENAFVFRPAYIRATARSVPRNDVGRFFAPLGALFDVFTDTLSIDCDVLARALLRVAKTGGDEHTVSNARAKALGAAVSIDAAR